MKVYQKIAGQPISTPIFRRDKQTNGVKIPVGTTVYRWETVTKLKVVFGFLRNDLDENRVPCDVFETVSPSDVTWFYLEEGKPGFLSDWALIGSYPDDASGMQGSQGWQGPGSSGFQGYQGSVGFQGYQGSASKFSVDVGTGGATGITVTHNLGTEDVVWSMRDKVTKDFVLPDAQVADANSILFVFDVAPTPNQYRAVIIG